MPLFDPDQQPARTLTAAKQALEIKRRENKLPTAGTKAPPLDARRIRLSNQELT
jgi:hypothetical protein